MNCPNCGSSQVISNKFTNFPLEQIEHVATHHLRDRRFGMAVGAYAIWGGIEVVNEFRKDWKCTHCGHKF